MTIFAHRSMEHVLWTEQDCLAYNPFEGDRTPVRVFSDGFVNAAKEHRCHICAEMIEKGSRHRARREIDLQDHAVGTFRFCWRCCAAMALVWTDAGEAIDQRTAIGMVTFGLLPPDAFSYPRRQMQ